MDQKNFSWLQGWKMTIFFRTFLWLRKNLANCSSATYLASWLSILLFQKHLRNERWLCINRVFFHSLADWDSATTLSNCRNDTRNNSGPHLNEVNNAAKSNINREYPSPPTNPLRFRHTWSRSARPGWCSPCCTYTSCCIRTPRGVRVCRTPARGCRPWRTSTSRWSGRRRTRSSRNCQCSDRTAQRKKCGKN